MISWTKLPQSVYTLVEQNPGSVLLQTSRFDASNETSYLFLNPVETLVANTFEELPQLFQKIEAVLANGHHVAGYMSYECGYHFESFRNLPAIQSVFPLAWLGVYDRPIIFNHTTGDFTPDFTLPDEHPVPSRQAFANDIALLISSDDYHQKILTIKDLIARGDTYQVNFTDRLFLETPLSPASAFAALSSQQPVSYSAFLNIAGSFILSLSPELFFEIKDGRIITRPMKGTMSRGLDLEEDSCIALRLQRDEKNRSEHIMIVDLLRNDLGRICNMGSVQVQDLFTVERYQTLFQMTSTISGTLRPSLTFYEIFHALFPSGSITGAPKIRTMQIIRDHEAQSRGIYTGTIGHVAPDRSSQFNVAIRTLTLSNGHAEMGVGGGIVADSDPASEYHECLLKASFLTRSPDDFQLIETILWDQGFYFLTKHLDRIAASAAYFNFHCDRAKITAQLEELAFTFDHPALHRVRLLLDLSGTVTLTSAPLYQTKLTGQIKLSAQKTFSRDIFLRHKTTRRALYDREYQNALTEGFDEVLFINEHGEITEGAISNIFLRKGERLLTPALSSGVLPGIYRRHLLETHPNAQEVSLTLEDLHSADAIFICNSVRGMNEVKLHFF